MSNNGPCLDCPDRVIGCHSSCERYLSWKATANWKKDFKRRDKLSTYNENFITRSIARRKWDDKIKK